MRCKQSVYIGLAALVLGYLGCSSANDALPTRSESTSTGDGTTVAVAAAGGSGGPDTNTDPEQKGGLAVLIPGGPTGAGVCPPANKASFTMSADDSNSMGSPGYAREMLKTGKAPDPTLIRTYEFLNYYNAGYAPAQMGTLAILPQLAQNTSPSGVPIANEYRLQIGVQAPLPDSPRRPMTVTIVVDTSQSMAGRGMVNARAVVKEIAKSLRPGDQLSIATLDAEATPLMDGRAINGQADIDAAAGIADALSAGGGSDLQGGLVHGYALAHEHFTTAGMNRLVFVTDGRANPKTINMGFIAEHAMQGDDQGIYLVGVGTGPAEGYNDKLLNDLTDYGRGAYVYIDTPEEAHAIFAERFSEVMDIGARSVSVTLTIPNYFSIQQYYGEAIEAQEIAITPVAQHLSAGDAMVFNMTLVACDPKAFDPTSQVGVSVDWYTPLTLEHRTTTASGSLADIQKADPAPMLKANAVIAYAEALKSLDPQRLNEAEALVKAAYEKTGSKDKDLNEIMGLIPLHPALGAAPN